MIEKILASTVVSAIVTGIILIFDNNRKNCISNITDERRKWREDIRKIIEDLSSNLQCTQEGAINRLQSRINAYGQGIDSKVSDSHIWETINELRQTKAHTEKYNLLISKLIDYLDLLLKYDWERSKKEIKLNFRNIVQLVYGLVLTVYAVYINLNNKLAFASNFGNFIKVISCAFFLMLVIPSCLQLLLRYKGMQEHKWERLVFGIPATLLLLIIEYKLCEWLALWINIDFIFAGGVILENLYFWFCLWIKYSALYEYVDAIKRVDNSYEEQLIRKSEKNA